MRFRIVVLVVAALVATTSPVLGGKPTHFRESIDETRPDTWCGVPVTFREQIRVNVLIDDAGRVKDLSLVRLTLTNSQGEWMTTLVAGPLFITESLNGSLLTIVSDHRGLQSHWVASDGTRFSDRGRITFVTVIDLQDLSDPTDDVFVSSDTTLQRGPHPEADSGFALFCDTVVRVLG